MSFWNVLVGMFENFFGSTAAMFSIFSMLGTLLGFGIYKLLAYFNVV